MSPVKIAFAFLLIAFTEVASWTIDLPEYRKYLFDKSEHDVKKKQNLKEFNKDEFFFDNIVPDSPHNKDEIEEEHENYHGRGKDSENDVYGGRYAEGYEYMSYMEKKVHGIVHNGSIYLEGLRRALENYGELLTNCSLQFNTSQPSNGPWQPQSKTPFPDSNQTQFSFRPFSPTSQLSNQAQNLFNNPPSQASAPTGFQTGLNGQSPGNLQSNNPQQPFSGSQSALNNPPGLNNLRNSSGNLQGPFSSSQGPFSSSLSSFSSSQSQINQTRSFFNQGFRVDRETCERATQVTEHVRRLAQLALWATRELQDRAYADKFDGSMHHELTDDEEEAEAELLLRLAFFLDKLAYLTGYEPQPSDYTTQRPLTTSTPSTPTTPLSVMGDVPDDVKMAMMRCLGANSTERATDRCRYPLQHPEFMRRLFNVTDSPDLVSPMTTELAPPKDSSFQEVFRNPGGFTRQKRDLTNSNTDLVDRQERQILTARTRQKRSYSTGQTHNHLTVDEKKNYKKDTFKSLASDLEAALSPTEILFDTNLSEKQEKRLKRSLDNNPLEKVLNYYVKYKVWTNSNSQMETPDSFDVENDLTADATAVRSVKKRSVVSKKAPQFRLPENPFQDISNFIKHKKGVNFVRNDQESGKLKEYLQKLRQSDILTSKEFVQKLLKVHARKSVQKRSIKYENKVLPNPSENPRQDISYYLKNKPGTEYQSNLVQAAQVRAGLEQVYQTGNILVVQRYGSNFNPAIPFPLGFGTFRSFFLDI